MAVKRCNSCKTETDVSTPYCSTCNGAQFSAVRNDEPRFSSLPNVEEMVRCPNCHREYNRRRLSQCPGCRVTSEIGSSPAGELDRASVSAATIYDYIVPTVSAYAVGSLLASFIFPILAVVFGHLAKAEIRRSKGFKTGDGIATAGLILGYLGIIGVALGLIIYLVNLANTASQSYY